VRLALARALPPVLGLAAVYTLLFLTDQRMASTFDAVASHLTDPRFTTKFWEFLLWSTSPFALALACIGLFEMTDGRRRLLEIVAAWCLPFFAFYYASTTSPRYFVPTALPVAAAAAVGAVALVQRVPPVRRRLATAVVALLTGLHLFVGLGHFTPGSAANLLTQGEFETHVGPVWTGAFIFKSYFNPWFLGRSVRHPGFGRLNGTQSTIDSALAAVAGGEERGRTIVVLQGGWNGHVFHYYALKHGAEYVSSRPGPVYGTETWMSLGGARIMTVNRRLAAYRDMTRLPVSDGDGLWVMAHDSTAVAGAVTRLPPGLSLTPRNDPTRPVGLYRVVRSAR
jgi:hypothetical protein